MRRIFAIVALTTLGFAGGASACINDNEQPQHEREFRSQYQDGDTPTPYERTTHQVRDLVLGGGGTALLIGAVVVARRRGRERA